MEVSDELLAAARKQRRSAVVELLAMFYPTIWRMAAGLTGREDVARGVVRFVMQKSLRAMRSWRDAGAPRRWFHHHTILTIRRARKHQPGPDDDPLLLPDRNDAAYAAFVRAVRALPMQQREAFVLHHGDRLDIRGLAVAMDCSTTAAENHLRQAEQILHKLSSESFGPMTTRLCEAYSRLLPAEQVSIPDVRRRIGRIILLWRVRRALGRLVLLLLSAAIAWGLWWLWRIVQHSMGHSVVG